MSKKVLAVLVLVIVVVAAFMMLSRNRNSSTSSSTPSSNQNQTQTQNQIKYTSANGFMPSSLTVKAGTTVTFLNNGGQLSVNSDPHPTHTDYPPLNLGVINQDQPITLTFDKRGTYGYHNHLNPSQKGTIVVQ